MIPQAIVRAAIRKGLDMIAICDHNTAGNTAAVKKAAGKDITVIAGMEITTAEEVHVLGLFPDPGAACVVGEKILSTLPAMETKMPAASSSFSLSDSIDIIRSHNGLAVAAHLDRPSFSVISQLGMIPEDITFDAIEISGAGVSSSRVSEFGSFGMPLLSSSDSHFLEDIGSFYTVLKILEPTFKELVLALRGIGGRGCSIA
jgi:PHP family Zn ribbon phosphoesterase